MDLRYLFAWLPMVLIAILNGTLRNFLFRRWMSRLAAHQLSCLTGIVLFGLYVWLLTCFWPLASLRHAILIGFSWLILTITFEFLFGHFVARQSWRRLFQDYNLSSGRLWVLVLLWVAVSPPFSIT